MNKITIVTLLAGILLMIGGLSIIEGRFPAKAAPIQIKTVTWCVGDSNASPSDMPVPAAVSRWNANCEGKAICKIPYDGLSFRALAGGDCHNGAPKQLDVVYDCVASRKVIEAEKKFTVLRSETNIYITLICH